MASDSLPVFPAAVGVPKSLLIIFEFEVNSLCKLFGHQQQYSSQWSPIKTFLQIIIQSIIQFRKSNSKEIKNISSVTTTVKLISYEEIINVNSHCFLVRSFCCWWPKSLHIVYRIFLSASANFSEFQQRREKNLLSLIGGMTLRGTDKD